MIRIPFQWVQLTTLLISSYLIPPRGLALTWDVVDGDGEDEENDSSPAAGRLADAFLLFTSCFLPIRAGRLRSSPPLVHVTVIHFICTKKGTVRREKKIMQTLLNTRTETATGSRLNRHQPRRKYITLRTLHLLDAPTRRRFEVDVRPHKDKSVTRCNQRLTTIRLSVTRSELPVKLCSPQDVSIKELTGQIGL